MRLFLIFFLLLPLVQHGYSQGEADSIDRKKLRSFIIGSSAFYTAGISYLHFIWYKDKQRVPFHFYNDAAGWMQIDKFGHTFGAYVESYIGYHWLRSAGVDRKKSLIYGGGLGFILQAPIEIFDGLYEGWGFSWSDMAANAAGAGIVIGNELLFKEQLVKYKFTFAPSPYREQAHGYLGKTTFESLFLDYNAHTYWFSLPANRVILHEKLPEWLSFSVGYSANGMFGEFENKRYYHGKPLPYAERYRQLLFSADIDWTRIPANSGFMKTLFKGMFFLKLPFPALEINSKGKIKLHPLYY